MNPLDDTLEGRRLTGPNAACWRRWGPYLSDRQWGTVREDYRECGDAWDYFPFAQARSGAYRWGEDGLGGFADERSNLCLSYFAARGATLETAPAEAPLLAALAGGATLGYRSLHETLTRFVRRARATSSLTYEERRHAEDASTHWLRHTHAIRAAESGHVPLDVLQENLGHEDPRTTSRYYRAQIERRQAALEKAFGKEEGER